MCDTAHTVFLGGRGRPTSFFRVGFRGCLLRGLSWWLVQRPGSSSAAMVLITHPFRTGRDTGWGGRRNLVARGEFPDAFLPRRRAQGPSTPHGLHFVKFMPRSG